MPKKNYSTGIAAINKTGISAFASKFTQDASGTPTWVSAGQSYFRGNSADAVGTSTDPKLTITYTLPSSARHKNPMVIMPN